MNNLTFILKITLFSLCLLFSTLLWFEMSTLDEVILDETNNVNALVIETVKKTKKPDDGLDHLALTAFDEMIQRPLFNETRLPFVPPEVIAPENKPKKRENRSSRKQAQFSLSAVVMSPEKNIAILQTDRGKSIQRVALGDTIEGWSVDEINSHSVQLKKGSEVQNLELEIKGSAINHNESSKKQKQIKDVAKKSQQKPETIEKQAVADTEIEIKTQEEKIATGE